MDRWVVFDLGGVMVQITLRFDELFQRVGLPKPPGWNIADLPSYPPFMACQAGQQSDEDYLQQLATDLGVDFSIAESIHGAVLVAPFPDTLELTQKLLAEGYRLAILSNTNARHWSELMNADRFPALANCEIRLASHEMGLEKPDPKIFAETERRLGASPPQITFFDDSAANVQAAELCGWSAHVIDPQNDPARQMRSLLSE
jgi:glucose-1-phosphatase